MKHCRFCLFLFLLGFCRMVGAQEINSGILNVSEDSVAAQKSFFTRVIDFFSETDSTYVTPNYYNWAFMVQNTNCYETYRLASNDYNQSLLFTPRPAIRFGPYLGWRWLFFGYSFDVNSFGKGHKSKKTEFELCLYSAAVGCDLIYRRTGDDFRLNHIRGFGEDATQYEGQEFKGIRNSITGINAYYIFNHRRFSYPAAYAQSTVQRKSCGSWKIGFSCTLHEMKFNYDELPEGMLENPEHPLGNGFKVNNLKYWDVGLSFGYAYNWVFKKNFLFNISMTPTIGYAKTHGKTSYLSDQGQTDYSVVNDRFSMDNVNINFTGRMGVVWNNTKRFAGMSLIVHGYNFKHHRLQVNNVFGTLNFYVGLNFHKRKEYRD